MAKASTIIIQLQSYLPLFTNLFTDQISISSLTRSGTTVTAVTSSPNNFVTGKIITIFGAKAPLAVTSLTRVGNVASGIVDISTKHDLTENDYLHDLIYITGANQPEYNVSALKMISSVNRYQFQYEVDENAVTPATGNIKLWDGAQRGYNGVFKITVVNPTTFTYEIPNSNFLNPYGTITARYGYRISGSDDLEDAIDAYTRQNTNNLWAFVILGDTDISKDREVSTDATATVTSSGGFLQIEVQRLFVDIFVPKTFEIAGRSARDSMEDLKIFLYQSLLRFKPPSGLSSNQTFGLASIGNRTVYKSKAFFVHEFEFEVINQVIIDDTFIKRDDVAFRDLFSSNTNNEVDPVNFHANLDDIPYVP